MKKLSILLLCFLMNVFSVRAQKSSRDDIAKMLETAQKELGFNGVVLVARNDSIILHQGYGYSDPGKKIVTDGNTVYNIASVSKAFTSVVVLKLVEENKLKLSDSLALYFPNAPNEKKGITIHQLLSHRSGLPQAYAADGESDREKSAGKILDLKMSGEPGKQFVYSNDNYTLLAIIIEKVTGQRWKDYIRKTILEPLGMKQTFFWGEPAPKELAVAAPNFKLKNYKESYGYVGATGIFSTAGDLLRFQKSVSSPVILSENSRSLLVGSYTRLGNADATVTDYYGYGMFHTEGRNNSTWFRGNEGGWGVSLVYWFPDTRTSLIVLSNQERLANGQKPHIYISSEIIKQLWPL